MFPPGTAHNWHFDESAFSVTMMLQVSQITLERKTLFRDLRLEVNSATPNPFVRRGLRMMHYMTPWRGWWKAKTTSPLVSSLNQAP